MPAYIRINAQVVTDLQVVTRLLSSRYLISGYMCHCLFPVQCCEKSGTSYHVPCYKVDDDKDLPQAVATKQIQAVGNKLLRASVRFFTRVIPVTRD